MVQQGQTLVSEHGYDELAEHNIYVKDIMAGVEKGVVVEDYPDFSKGPCVHVLQKDADGEPIHVVWGIPKEATSPAVIVTPTDLTLKNGRMISGGVRNEQKKII